MASAAAAAAAGTAAAASAAGLELSVEVPYHCVSLSLAQPFGPASCSSSFVQVVADVR